MTSSATIDYTPAGSGAVTRTVEDKLRESVSVRDFGAIADGNSHPLSSRYGNLTDAQLDYPHVTSLSQEIDWAAIQAAVDYAVSSGIGRVTLGHGRFILSDTISLTGRGIAIVGYEASSRQFGSGPRASYLIWTGGAAPMFTCAGASFGIFRGFGVENRGAATGWLDASGSMGHIFDDLSFVHTSQHTSFSRAVIYADGVALGYSVFRLITAKSPAPVFVDIDGQGTSNGITNLVIEGRSIFDVNTQPMTVIKLKDESIENVTIRDCTFNVNAGNEMVIVDTSSSPLPTTITNLTFETNEIDVAVSPSSGSRFFKLANVPNVALNNNAMNFGGSLTAMATLANSSVASCQGNYWKSLNGPLFEADATSQVTCGTNSPVAGSTRGVFTASTAGVVELAYGPAVNIDLKRGNACPHCFVLNVTSAGSYDIRLPNTGLYAPAPGTMFTVTIRNTSGGAIAAGSFNSAWFSTQGALTAPAAGFCRTYSFYYDGRKAVEIARCTADVPNT